MSIENEAKLLIFIMLILLLLSVFSQELKIKEISHEPKTIYEAQLVSFSAILNKECPDANYIWTIDDGTIIYGKFPKFYHIFYLQDSTRSSEEYNVNLTVKCNNEETSKLIKVKVINAGSKITLFQPDFQHAIEKGIPIKFQFQFNYSGGEAIPNIRDVSLKFLGELYTRNSEKIKKESEMYYLELKNLGYKIKSLEFVEISGRRGTRKMRIKAPLYFKPARLTIEDDPLSKRKFFVGSKIGKLCVSIIYPDGSKADEGSFFAKLYLDGNTIEKKRLIYDLNSKRFCTKFEHVFDFNEIFKEFYIKIEGTDPYENKIDAKLPFAGKYRVENNNPEFNLVVESPDFTETNNFGVLENVIFLCRIEGKKNYDANVFLRFKKLGITKTLKKEGDIYKLELKLPEKVVYNEILEIIAKAKDGNIPLEDYESFRINLSNEIKIMFIYPAKGRSNYASNSIMVALKYAKNNRLLTNKNIAAKVSIDNETFNANFMLDKNKRLYVWKPPKEILGKHKLAIYLQKPFKGSSSIEFELIKPIPWTSYVIMLAIFFILLAAVYLFWNRMKYFQAERAKLRARLIEIEREMKELQAKLFTRRISIEEYKEKLLSLQNEKESIESLLLGNKSLQMKEPTKTSVLSFLSRMKSRLVSKVHLPKFNQISFGRTYEYESSAQRTPFTPKEPFLHRRTKKYETRENLEFEHYKSVTFAPKAGGVETQILVPKLEKEEDVLRETFFAPNFPKKVEKVEKKQKEVQPSIDKEYLKTLIKKNVIEEKLQALSKMYTAEELQTIKKLYLSLQDVYEKTKPGDLYKLLIEEGYSPTIALAVIKLLYLEK